MKKKKRLTMAPKGLALPVPGFAATSVAAALRDNQETGDRDTEDKQDTELSQRPRRGGTSILSYLFMITVVTV